MINIEKIDTFAGHRDCVYALAAHEGGFFSAGGDGFVIDWKLNRPDLGSVVARMKHSIYAMAFDENRKELYVAENFEGIHVIDVRHKSETKSLKLSDAAIFDLKIIGDTIFVAGGDGVLSIIDKTSFSFRKHIKFANKSIRRLAFHHPSKNIWAACSDGNLYEISTKNFELISSIDAHSNSVFGLTFTDNYSQLISVGRDAQLKVWQVKDGSNLHSIPAHLFAINDVAVNPQNGLVATCSMDKTIKIWDGANFKLLKVIDKARHANHGTSINTLRWISEKILVSVSDDKLISVWKIEQL